MTAPREHVPELTWLKGLAILGVVCIHARFGAGNVLFDHVLNRSVPIFLVLFGITVELWWSRRDASPSHRVLDFYRTRLRRIVIPFWAMVAIWWLVAIATGYSKELGLGPPEAALTFAAYAPWIGTSWFVTLIIELVILYPVLRWILLRAGAPLVLLLSAAACAISTYYIWSIVFLGRLYLGGKVPPPYWFYDWIFPPRAFWNVLAGAVVARTCGGRMSKRATAFAVLATAIGWIVAVVVRGPPEDFIGGALREQAATYVSDVPLALALLGLFRWVSLPSAVTRFLAWCGTFSWGIYLGHLLVHELVHIAGFTPELRDLPVRGLYALALFASGSALAVAGDAADRGLRRILSRRSPKQGSAAPTIPRPEGRA